MKKLFCFISLIAITATSFARCYCSTNIIYEGVTYTVSVGYDDDDCNPADGGVSNAQGIILSDGQIVGGGTPTASGLNYICGIGYAKTQNPFTLFE